VVHDEWVGEAAGCPLRRDGPWATAGAMFAVRAEVLLRYSERVSVDVMCTALGRGCAALQRAEMPRHALPLPGAA
jgi:preprotein translocase subunit SecF